MFHYGSGIKGQLENLQLKNLGKWNNKNIKTCNKKKSERDRNAGRNITHVTEIRFQAAVTKVVRK